MSAEANETAQPAIPITYAMLAGTGEGFSTRIQQAVLPAPYREQVRQEGLNAWYKLDEGPTESPIAGVRQKPGKSLPNFVVRVEHSLRCKLLAGDLQDQFVKMLVWEEMNANHLKACAGLREAHKSPEAVKTKVELSGVAATPKSPTLPQCTAPPIPPMWPPLYGYSPPLNRPPPSCKQRAYSTPQPVLLGPDVHSLPCKWGTTAFLCTLFQSV